MCMHNFTVSRIVIDVMKKMLISKTRVARGNTPELLRDWWSFIYKIFISVFGRRIFCSKGSLRQLLTNLLPVDEDLASVLKL